jgi:predicted transport protein
MKIGDSIPDFLCKDSGNRIVIIEVKLGEDMNALFQALGYYADVNASRYVLAERFSDRSIDTKQTPRIILVAKNFTDKIRHLATLVVPEVQLYEYTTLRDSTGKQGIVYHSVSLPKFENNISDLANIDDYRNYITDTALHTIFDAARERIKARVSGVEEYVTQSYVGYKYRGRQIGWISPQRKSFDVGAQIVSDKRETVDYPSIRVTSVNDDIDSIIDKIHDSYQNLLN